MSPADDADDTDLLTGTAQQQCVSSKEDVFRCFEPRCLSIQRVDSVQLLVYVAHSDSFYTAFVSKLDGIIEEKQRNGNAKLPLMGPS